MIGTVYILHLVENIRHAKIYVNRISFNIVSKRRNYMVLNLDHQNGPRKDPDLIRTGPGEDPVPIRIPILTP